ncbi:DUF4167 domain-containing protein [Pseudogemmobacter humi]|uniref:DUF4167 domain-containing protein n=1 Tax=Pseudogemmobacter humi TaxID=2483812 RepID=A0A3P5XN63_9RHOB|nr:DUF4167 domain-containing protein [Pseudogemmobacter humi]VDC30151.1 hypothetical protein XINFAN_02453 [Pseudogemmobacter humi]
MRSSKKRSRSSQNRPRSLGNIVNRVFDSSGPEGKVRGTPQQIIEKYQMLARDAQLSNDRVAAENFLQHAEHYTRMLAEAQRELAAEQEARQQQYQQQNGNREFRDRNDRGDRSDRGERDRDRDQHRPQGERGGQPAAAAQDVIDFGTGEGGLVELPETSPAGAAPAAPVVSEPAAAEAPVQAPVQAPAPETAPAPKEERAARSPRSQRPPRAREEAGGDTPRETPKAPRAPKAQGEEAKPRRASRPRKSGEGKTDEGGSGGGAPDTPAAAE